MPNDWFVLHRKIAYGMFNTKARAEQWAKENKLARAQVLRIVPTPVKSYRLEDLDHE